MKPPLCLWLGGGLLAVALPLAAAPQTPTPPPKATAERIKQFIDDLDSPRFAVRDRATRELLGLGGRAFAPLHKALTSPRSAEFALRVRAILRQLASAQPGGEVVNGLKVCLLADRDTVKSGESLKLTTTLWNMKDRPLLLQVGFAACGNYFTCGAAVRRVVPAEDWGRAPQELRPQAQFGFASDGSIGPRWIFVTIPAKSPLTYEATVPVVRRDEKTYLFLSAAPRVPKYFLLEVPAGATHTLRMALENAPGSRPEHHPSLNPQLQPPPVYWTGKVRSNDVQVRIVP